MDTIPTQTVPPPQEAPIVAAPKSKTNFKKFLDVISWIFLLTFLPITVLIFLSQNTIPGDFFYPAKRGMEGVILAAASVNPATRAAFSTDLTEARFKEAQGLIVSKSNASGLTTFIDDVQTTQAEVATLQSPTERANAREKLAVKIEEYQNGLTTLQAKTEQNIIAYQSQEAPVPPPAGGSPSFAPNLPSETPTSAPTPTLIPTRVPTSIIIPLPSSKTQPTPTLTLTSATILSVTPISTSIPTLTIAPTAVQVVPTIPPQPESTQVLEQRQIVASIKDTKEKLDKIKKDLEEKKTSGLEQKTENKKGGK